MSVPGYARGTFASCAVKRVSLMQFVGYGCLLMAGISEDQVPRQKDDEKEKVSRKDA